MNSIINPQDTLFNTVDQTIDEQYIDRMEGMDRISDVVRSLREFSGNAGEFSSWKKSVDRILQIYERKKGTPQYFGILNVIRNKIVGNADMVLESYNTPLDWKAISKCLNMHYADKRDLTTLEYQMTTLVQGNWSIEEFYQKVYSHLSLILNKLSCLEAGQEALQLLTQTYRDKALDTFVRGLRGDLPRLLGMKEPADLPQALHLCLKLQNQNFRSSYANTINYGEKGPNMIPPLPPRTRHNNNFNRPRLSHHPHLNQVPRYQGNYGRSNYNRDAPGRFNPSQRTHQPNIPPRSHFLNPPEAREVDRSIRTATVN